MKPLRLMIPGPVDVTPEVRAAMAEPMIAHYGAEWTSFYWRTVKFLRCILSTTGDIFLIPGSGSAGLEAGLCSLLGSSGRVLIPINGFFGERLAEIARTYSRHVEVISCPLGQAVDPTGVATHLERKRYDAVAMVHCETSTGVLNPVRQLGPLCRERGVLFVVDAISSLGIERLLMDEWNIDVCVAASQKGLETPPGLALVAVGQQAWKRIEKADSPGWYLNLKVWREYTKRWGDWHPHPVTQAVSQIRSLHLSLERILQEGIEHRVRRHERITALLREGLRGIGLQPLAPDNIASHGVTAVNAPGSISVPQLIESVRQNHGILLAGALGPLRDKAFRIGHMGPAATQTAVVDVLAALETCLGLPRPDLTHGASEHR